MISTFVKKIEFIQSIYFKMVLDWWQKTVIYQIYLPSFKDSNSDGMGDFLGLISKFDYFEFLKVNTLLLSPFYPSPMLDNGYDVSDYCDVDQRFGTLGEFDFFLSEAKKRNMNVLINFVANHTSDEHIWFKKGVQNIEPYKDYYVWVDPKDGCNGLQPPNNWTSVFGGSAWTWNEERKQYFLHQFMPEQPELNLRNPYVREELRKVLIFWLEKGVDGFRIDAASHLYENADLLDEPVFENTQAKAGEYAYLDHIYTKGQPENIEILSEWRSVLDSFSQTTGKCKIMLVEIYEDIGSQMCYYGSMEHPIADIPINYGLRELNFKSTAYDLFQIITYWLNAMPPGKHPNWLLGCHDYARLATRVTSSLLDGLHMVFLLSKGVPICYYGDELGMEDVTVEPDDIKDRAGLKTYCRDPSRSPMQWNNKSNAGFTNSSKSWLPIHENFTAVNVQSQKSKDWSHLQIFQKLMCLKNEAAIQLGEQAYPLLNEYIFSMTRVLENSKSFLVVLNMGTSTCNANFSGSCTYLPDTAEIEIWNNPMNRDGSTSMKRKLYSLSLMPAEAMVLSFLPENIS